MIERSGNYPPHTDAVEKSLLALTRLTFLKLDYMWRWDNTDGAGGFFSWSEEGIPKAIALMTELRCRLSSFVLYIW